MKSMIIIFASLTLSSCMHVGMMGTGDGHHSEGPHEMMSDPVLEKEVIIGDVRAIALFPPIDLGSDVILTLRLMDARTAAPISGAHVYLHAQYAHRLTPHDNHGESLSQRKETEHDINIDQEVKESPTLGVYTIPYGFSQPGEHRLTFHITAIGGRKLEHEITVEATRTISGEGHEHQSGVMGGTSTTIYVIIGAAVMGAMIIVMLTAGSGMF